MSYIAKKGDVEKLHANIIPQLPQLRLMDDDDERRRL